MGSYCSTIKFEKLLARLKKSHKLYHNGSVLSVKITDS